MPVSEALSAYIEEVMGISHGEQKEIDAMQKAQTSANAQSASNVVTFKKYFGPKMESLTSAISEASRGSSFLSKVLIGITVVGTIIAGLQWYSAYGRAPDFSEYSDARLHCVVTQGKNQDQELVEAVIEFCSREHP
jgi:hypothetical protein